MSIIVRGPRPDELDATARVLASAFEQYRPAAGAGVSPELRRAFEVYLSELADVRARLDEAELFVAVEGRAIVGTGALYPPTQVQAYARAVAAPPWPGAWASLRALGVDPAHRGRGIARLLTDARVGRARELGASAVAIHTSTAFEAARAMYLQGGWRRVPEFDHQPAPEITAEAYVLALV